MSLRMTSRKSQPSSSSPPPVELLDLESWPPCDGRPEASFFLKESSNFLSFSGSLSWGRRAAARRMSAGVISRVYTRGHDYPRRHPPRPETHRGRGPPDAGPPPESRPARHM